MSFTPIPRKLFFCFTVKLWNWWQLDVYWNNQPSSGGTRLCPTWMRPSVCSVTLGHLPPVCAHLLWCRQHRVCVLYPLIGQSICHQNSQCFHLIFLRPEFMVSTLLLHPQMLLTKGLSSYLRADCADVKMGICIWTGRKKNYIDAVFISLPK